LHPSDAQTPKAYDASAQKRRDMYFIETLRQWKREVCTYEGELGIATIYCVARKDWMVAEILHLVIAEPAISVGSTHPGDANPGSQRHRFGPAFNDLANNLMPWNQSRPQGRQIAFNDMQVSTADSTCNHTQQHIAWLKLGAGHVFDSKVHATYRGHSVIDCGFHL
jgi:hypothetical protein